MRRSVLIGAAPLLVSGQPTLDADGVVHISGGRFDSTALHAINADGLAKWIFHANSSVVAHAEGPNGTVYVATEDSALYGLDSASGNIKWCHMSSASGDVSSFLPVTRDGTVYFESGMPLNYPVRDSGEHVLEAIDVHGALKWSLPINARHKLRPEFVAPDGTLLVLGNQYPSLGGTCDDRSLCAVQADGSLKWSFRLDYEGDHFVDKWAFAEDGSIFVKTRGNQGNNLLRLSGKDGGLLWKVSLPNSYDYMYPGPSSGYDGTFLGINNEVYVNGLTRDCIIRVFGFDGTVRRDLPCFTIESQSTRQNEDGTEEDIFISTFGSVFSNQPVTVSSSVLAYSGHNGQLLWDFTIDDRVTPDGVRCLRDGTVLVADLHSSIGLDHHVYAIRDGEEVWKTQTGGFPGMVMAEDGTTYIQGQYQSYFDLVAVGIDGAEKWRYTPASQTVMI